MSQNVTAQDQEAPQDFVLEGALPRALHRVCSSGSVSESFRLIASVALLKGYNIIEVCLL